MQRKQPFLCTCVSGANRRLVVVLETGRFLKDQLLQPLFGKVVQFHGESEGLLCYRLHVSHTRTHAQTAAQCYESFRENAALHLQSEKRSVVVACMSFTLLQHHTP